MNSSLSKVFVAICGSSLVNLSSAVKVGGFSFTAAPPRFFEFVYGINQQTAIIQESGRGTFVADINPKDFKAYAESFGRDLDAAIKNAAPINKRGCFSRGSSNHELVELKTAVDAWMASRGPDREDLKRAAGLFYLQNHRKILKQSGLSTHPFIVDRDGGVQEMLRNALQIALHEKFLLEFDLDAFQRDYAYDLQEDADDLQTDYAQKEDALASKLTEFVLFGFTHGFHLGLKADSPSWFSNVTNAGKFFDAVAAKGFNWKDFVRNNISDIVTTAAGASKRCFGKVPVGKKSSRRFLKNSRQNHQNHLEIHDFYNNLLFHKTHKFHPNLKI